MDERAIPKLAHYWMEWIVGLKGDTLGDEQHQTSPYFIELRQVMGMRLNSFEHSCVWMGEMDCQKLFFPHYRMGMRLIKHGSDQYSLLLLSTLI